MSTMEAGPQFIGQITDYKLRYPRRLRIVNVCQLGVMGEQDSRESTMMMVARIVAVPFLQQC
ncbi:MAG: hypothetical protein R3C02_24190 [Planctomycetaceae bacterium]